MVGERVYRFTVPPFSPLLGCFRPDTTPAAPASVAIDPELTWGFSACLNDPCRSVAKSPKVLRHAHLTGVDI